MAGIEAGDIVEHRQSASSRGARAHAGARIVLNTKAQGDVEKLGTLWGLWKVAGCELTVSGGFSRWQALSFDLPPPVWGRAGALGLFAQLEPVGSASANEADSRTRYALNMLAVMMNSKGKEDEDERGKRGRTGVDPLPQW